MNISKLTASIIQTSTVEACFALAGGGSDALADLLRTPGASKFVSGASIPYSPDAMTDFLGCTPETFCCQETAWKMAQQCFQLQLARIKNDTVDNSQRSRGTQAVNGVVVNKTEKKSLFAYQPEELQNKWGVACTASLSTNRIKRGNYRAYIVIQSLADVYTFTVQFVKSPDESEQWTFDQFSELRAIQERIVSDVILSALRFVQLKQDEFYPEYSIADSLMPEFSVQYSHRTVDKSWYKLLSGEVDALIWGKDSKVAWTHPAILPGSFNPIHDGHRQMRKIAEQILSKPVFYELSILNADKPPVSMGELAYRLEEIASGSDPAPVILSRCPYFIDKARHIPGTTFVLGADTIERLNDVRKYYQNQEEFDSVLNELERLKTRFLVFGRPDTGGNYIGLKDLTISKKLLDLCQEVPQETFCNSLRSTDIRSGREAH